jgi:hypothetical protein
MQRSVMGLAARAHDFGIIDRHHRLPVADERVAHACEAAAEGRELHVLLLQGPVREEFRHSCRPQAFALKCRHDDEGKKAAHDAAVRRC